MDAQQCKSLQKFDDPKTEILKKRLLNSVNTSIEPSINQNNPQHNVLLNALRAPISSSMIVSSMQAPQSSMPLTHNLVTHSLAPVKIHTNNSPYPLQLSTVHVPVQIPGSTSNINVPVQLSTTSSTVPLQIGPTGLPIQVSGTTNVPVQLPAGETINVPLQLPTGSQNIQLTGSTLPSMPLLQNNQSIQSSIIHVHMGSNQRQSNMDSGTDLTVTASSQVQMPDSTGVQVKMNTTTGSQVHIAPNPGIVQIPNTTNSSIQLRNSARPMPHVVYIQTPNGLKPVTSTDMISQASTSGNPPQIIVRRPVTNNSNIHLISNVNNKPNLAPKASNQNKSSILAPVNASQPIVIQKPKNEKMIVPVSIAPNIPSKQAIAYLGSVKKSNQKPVNENQSILISNNQTNANNSNQKLFLTPMPKIPNTKFILPVTLPATMASKGPIINLQIANGQIQNDPQGNITVMRDTIDATEMPPLQPLGKSSSMNGKDNAIPLSPKGEKPFAISIPGSRAEPTGEQGEYCLSIPETNASLNDDIYTVSITDEDGAHREKSFTLAIPEKGKSLLNRNIIDRNDLAPVTVAAPAILRRSNSDNSDRKTSNANLKRRISLCTDNMSSKNVLLNLSLQKPITKSEDETENNDDHRVPSLFCDEKLEKDLDTKNMGDSDSDEYKVKIETLKRNSEGYYEKLEEYVDPPRIKQENEMLEEDPPGLIWNNGIATLQGSNLQFRANEFGIIDLISVLNHEESNGTCSKYQSPMKRQQDKKPNSPEDMFCCDGCGCHGMAADFITPNFCSVTCQNEVQKVLQKKRDRERTELLRKRNKIKKLLMKKQLSDSDIPADGKDDKVPLKHYDSMPSTNLSESSLLKMSDEAVENEKYPWMCGKNGFSWMRYLEVCKAKAAPVKLFKNPFPLNKNGFRVGMRMEAIDPQHPSSFCVVSVAEVQGYRMRLHFDEYPDVYDFWVNADSINIFPPGWCDKNGRPLKPPATYTSTAFSWPLYLKQIRAVAAPRQLFQHVTNSIFKPNCFRIGMKLEAEDRKNDLVCVATVADTLDHRILVNFDSWDEMYDYWVELNSPYIHPVGWAELNGVSLTPPNFYKDPDTFSWESYLAETGSSEAPPRAFKHRLPQGFEPGMKLEVVDKRVPFLIRVATITAVKRHQVRVSFDGWPDDLSYWLDDDSPDLHPVGWCLKTGHPLEPPLSPEELSMRGPCGVGGCRGLGSAHGGAHKQHVSAHACPYARPAALHAPRTPRTPDLVLPRERRVLGKPLKSRPASSLNNNAPKDRPRGRPPKHKRVEEVVKNDPMSDEDSIASSGCKRWRGTNQDSESTCRSPAPALTPALTPAHAVRINAHLTQLALPADPALWTQEEVSALVARVAGNTAGAATAAAQMGGAELVMASREELVACLKLRLGPAVKLYAVLLQLRQICSALPS
ncbi:uncharacterized protein LOC114245644 isoform X1 [Bombyx mandarina]|uniref:Uncharacterized protein LOC114245644 isoform X1 n=2 Tax=Bombyx mandarina TaxID=7092 RepID=A0A6J2K031_BOMMA|nr:uncharacterized protein LOC114245644 isoform X1 [Bombyx mandarina]